MINIIIVNWNSSSALLDCLRSICKSDNYNFRVILIDNNSEKSDFDNLRNIYSEFNKIISIELLISSENLGYAGGNNYGIRYINSCNYDGDILILNPDVVLYPYTLSAMQDSLTDNVGIVTPRTFKESGEIDYDIIQLRGFQCYKIISPYQIVNSDFSQGSCMLISRNIFDTIGLFDENYFLYWEEFDFSLRVKSTGKSLITNTAAHIIRKSNDIIRQPMAFYYSVRNAKLIYKKYPNFFSLTSYLMYVLYLFTLIFKFIFVPKIFIMSLYCFYRGIIDSLFNKYGKSS